MVVYNFFEIKETSIRKANTEENPEELIVLTQLLFLQDLESEELVWSGNKNICRISLVNGK